MFVYKINHISWILKQLPWLLWCKFVHNILLNVQDGLTHPTDTGVRDFSAACIREFVTWSIKQLTELDLKQHPLNVKAVIKQINTYCLHPSPYKRFGKYHNFSWILLIATLLCLHLRLYSVQSFVQLALLEKQSFIRIGLKTGE